MHSRLILGTFAVGFVISALAACGSDDSPAGSGGTSSASGSVTASSSKASSTVTASGTGGSAGDGNDSFETATELDIGTGVDGELDPTGDVDYYKFSGLKGQVLYFDINAEDTDDVSYDPTYINTVITLYDADQKQIAENNQPVPNSSADARLFTILSADGEYYLRVTECWTWSSDPSMQCGGRADKGAILYTLNNFAIDAAANGVVEEVEPNDDAATATPLEYEVYSGGGYYYTDSWGFFGAATDVDVYKFTVPIDDQPMLDGRETARFYALPGGTSGDGSATNIGKMYIIDPLNPLVRIAELDPSKGLFLWPVLDFDKEYLFFVEHPGGASSPNDFYFFRHTGSGSNPVEVDLPLNDTPATAEVVEAVDNNDGSWSHYIDGDVLAAPADVDHYTVDATLVAAGSTISVSCGSARYGSGLVDLTATLLKGDGTPVANATGTETADANVFIDSIPIPAGESTLIVKVEAASQVMTVSGTFYRCGFHLRP